MALSGSQLTRIGIIGFPGRPYAGFTAKSETVVTFLTFGVLSFISQSGQGVESTISTSGKGVVATISQSMGVLAIINPNGKGVKAVISQNGLGVEGKL
jgi:hypothetical protein